MTVIEHFPSSPSSKTIDEIATPEIQVDRVNVVECLATDPELRALAKLNEFAIVQGSINMAMLSNLKESQGWAYKILANVPDQAEPKLVGGVYAVKKGMDIGSIQIAYFVDEESQGEGYGTDAVEAVTGILSEKYDIIANIDERNEHSEKIVRGLGYGAIWNESGMNTFLKNRKRSER